MNRGEVDIRGHVRECSIYTSYLVNWEADQYVLEKYHEAHTVSEILRHSDHKKLDTILVAISLRRRVHTKLVDVYTRMFYPTCIVRKKWILLLGILESYGPTHSYFETTENGGKSRLYLRMILSGCQFIVLLGIAVITLMPVHITCTLQEKYFINKA